MDYHIKGVTSDTRIEVEFNVVAESREEAAEAARDRGIEPFEIAVIDHENGEAPDASTPGRNS